MAGAPRPRACHAATEAHSGDAAAPPARSGSGLARACSCQGRRAARPRMLYVAHAALRFAPSWPGPLQMLIAGDFSMSCVFVALMSMTAEMAEALSGVSRGAAARGPRGLLRSGPRAVCGGPRAGGRSPGRGAGSRLAPGRGPTCRWPPLSPPCAPQPRSQLTGVGEFPLSIAITVVSLIAFGPICGLFGGALFNPVHNVAFMAAGKDSVKLNAARMAAQVAGAVLGAYLAVSMLPEWLKE